MTDYNQIADKWDQTRYATWAELEFFRGQIKKGVRILDAGSGNGRLVQFLETLGIDYDYLGIDLSTELLKKARQNFPRKKFSEQDLRKFLRPQQFDVIFCVAVLHHFGTAAERRKVLRNLYVSLKPGGQLFLTTWNLFQPRYLKSVLQSFIEAEGGPAAQPLNCCVPFDNRIKRHIHVFTKSEMEHLLAEAGFQKPEIFYAMKKVKTNAILGRNLLVLARK